MTIPDLTRAQVEQAREKAREHVKEKILAWYAENSGGKLPTQQCEDRKAYRGKVIWYLEPPIPLVANPILIEEFLGDSWTLRIEYGYL